MTTCWDGKGKGEGDTFYCADPAPYVAGERIPLDASWLGESYGHSQDAVLANATAYWSVTDCSVTADMDEVPLDALGLRKTERIGTIVRDIVTAEKTLRNATVVAMSA